MVSPDPWHYRVVNTHFTSGWGFSEINYLFWIFPPLGSCGVMYRYTYRSGDFDTVITRVIWIHIWVLHTYPSRDPGQEPVPRLRKGYSQGRAVSNGGWAPREGESQLKVVPKEGKPQGRVSPKREYESWGSEWEKGQELYRREAKEGFPQVYL